MIRGTKVGGILRNKFQSNLENKRVPAHVGTTLIKRYDDMFYLDLLGFIFQTYHLFFRISNKLVRNVDHLNGNRDADSLQRFLGATAFQQNINFEDRSYQLSNSKCI